MPKILRRLRINEVSSVTRGAGEGVKIMLMKRDDTTDPANKDAGNKDTGDKNTDTLGGRVGKFFTDLFKRQDVASFDEALAGLAESVKSIIEDDGEADKDDMLAKTFTQFHEHVSPLLGGPAPPRQPTDKEGDPKMSAQLNKALGLKEDASEEDALKAIAELVSKQPPKKNGGKNGEDDDEDEEDEEKALKALPAPLRKIVIEGKLASERVAKLEAEAALVGFQKQCADIGLPASHAITLQKAYAGDKAAIDEILKLTKTGFAAAREAGTFKELGGSGNGGGGTAHEQFTALATKYLRDHPGEKLTHEQAYAKLYQDDAYKDLRLTEARESGRIA